MYQQGNFTLTTGQTSYTVSFSQEFPVAVPSLILTDVFNSLEEDPQLHLEGNVISKTTDGFVFELASPPDSNNYVLAWMASDGLGVTPIQSSGVPVADFPQFNSASLPDNTLFPAILKSGTRKSITVTWGRMKAFLVSAHTHLVEQISNATAIGKSLMKSSTAEAARTTISAAAAAHTHTASQLSDSTATGRDLITATDEADARAAIDAAALAHTHAVADITGESHVEDFLVSDNIGEALGAIGAAPVAHTHVASDISDIGAVGINLVQADTAADARTEIEAMKVYGWVDGGAITAHKTLTSADYGKKFTISTPYTVTVPVGLTDKFKIGFAVLVDDALTITPDGSTIKDYQYTTISGSTTLKKGWYILENTEPGVFVLVGYENTFRRSLNGASSLANLKTVLDLEIADISDIGDAAAEALVSDTSPQLNALTYTREIVDSGLDIDSLGYSNVAGRIYTQSGGELALSSNLEVNQTYWIRNNNESGNLTLLTEVTDYVNEVLGGAITVFPGEIVEIVLQQKAPNKFFANCRDTNTYNNGIVYVSDVGNDLTAQVGNPTLPFLTFAAAKTAANGIHTGYGANYKLTYVMAGNYALSGTGDINPTNFCNMYFEPGVHITASDCNVFSITDAFGSILNIYGDAKFSVDDGANLIYMENYGSVNIKANEVLVTNNSNFAFITGAGGSLVDAKLAKILVNADCHVLNDTAASDYFYLEVGSIASVKEDFLVGPSSKVFVSIKNGDYFVNNSSIVDQASDPTGEFSLHLENSRLYSLGFPTPDDYLIRGNSCFIRVTGNNGIIQGNFNDSAIYYESGGMKLSDVVIIGSIYVDGNGLVLDGVHILGAEGESIKTTPANNNTVTIYQNCITPFAPDYDELNFTGGSILVDSNFTIY